MHFDLRRLGLAVALAGLGYAGWTMLNDDADLGARAAEVACRGRVCNAVQKKKTRDLFGWTFSFVTYGEQTMTVNVACTRALWVAGDYHCDVSEVGAAADRRWE